MSEGNVTRPSWPTLADSGLTVEGRQLINLTWARGLYKLDHVLPPASLFQQLTSTLYHLQSTH